MEVRWPGAVAAVAVAVAACGARSRPAPIAAPATVVAVDHDPDADAGDDDGLELVSDRGHVDPDLAAAKVAPHAAALNACYADRLDRRKWLGGSVELTWSLAADGAVTDVRLAQSDLGAWPIERCLVEVARAIEFGKPIGGKADVTFPVMFSAGSGALTWEADQAVRAVGGKPAGLTGCAKPGGLDPTNVTVTIYVGTRGKVLSVGFAAPAGVPAAWADCAEAKVAAWTLTDPRGKVAKLSFVYQPAAIPDEDE